jgi:hypothetical protein
MMMDFNGDSGLLDLVYIKPSQTGTGTVEIHIASAALNYQTRILDTVESG